jgi:hypothetical protein
MNSWKKGQNERGIKNRKDDLKAVPKCSTLFLLVFGTKVHGVL